MNKIEYAVLSYYPSIIATENKNVGIAFHNIDTDEREFYIITKWNKLHSFDDEMDIDFMKLNLKGIKNRIESNISNFKEAFNLSNFARHYVNELRFSKVQCVETDYVDEFIMQTKKIHLRSDFDKKERLNTNEELKYIKKFIKASYPEYSDQPIRGKYEENIAFDYKIGNYAFKNFTFDNKEPSSLMVTAKYWSYNAWALKDRYKIVFLYDNDANVIDKYKSILEILNENSYKVITRDEIYNLLSNEVVTDNINIRLS